MKNMKKHFTILTLALLLVVGTESAQAAFSEPGVSFPTVPSSFVYPLTAPVSVSEGGTGRQSLTANRLLVGNGTGQVGYTPAPTAGYLSWNGSAFVWDTPAGSIGGTGSSGRVPFFSNASTLANSPIQTDGNSAEIPNNSFNALSLCIDWICKSSWPTSVTSVGLSAPSIFNVTGSPVTGSGSLALNLASQAANRVFAGPASGANADPTFRTLVAADIPNLAASKITSGVLATARLGSGPASASTYLRGDGTWAAVSTGSGGDVTAVNASTNLTGGGTSGDVTLAVVSSPTFAGRITAADGFTGDASANIGGTGAAAYFPNGLWSNGSTAWIYGTLVTSGLIQDNDGRVLRDDNGGWVRTHGDTGWYSQTHGGGWYMTDPTWIRSYGSKSVYVDSFLRADGGLVAGATSSLGSGTINATGNITTTGNIGVGTTNPVQKLVVTGGESNFSSTSYTDPAPGTVYDAKFGGSNNGIAVNGSSIFNSSVEIDGSLNANNVYVEGGISLSKLGSTFIMDYNSFSLTSSESSNAGGTSFSQQTADGVLAVRSTGDNNSAVYGSATGSNGVGVYGATGNTSSDVKYGVAGVAQGNNAWGVYCYAHPSFTTRCGGNKGWSVSSDARLKENISTITSGLEKVLNLRGVVYELKEDEDDKLNLGFIAQEVEKVLPEAVTKGKDGYYTMTYESVTPVLVEAIKELKAENDDLKARIEALEAKLK